MGFRNWWKNFKLVEPNLIMGECLCVMKLILFWTGKRKMSTTAIVIVSWILCTLPFFLVIPQFFYSLTLNDLKEFVDWLCPFSSILLTQFKMFYCNQKRKKMEELYENLQENYKGSNDYQVHKILHQARVFCRRLTFVYTILFSFICIIYSLQPIFKLIYLVVFKDLPEDYKTKLPYKEKFLYDIETDRVAFWMTYAFTLVNVYILSMSLSGFDTIFITLSYYIMVQFKLVNVKIKSLRPNLNTKFFRKNLQEIIEQHNFCIQMTNKLEDIFNYYLLVQIVSSSVIICIVFYQASLDLGLNDDTLRLLSYIVGAVTQLFIFCWVSEQIKAEAQNLGVSLYCISWYSLPLSMQKSIILTMQQSQRAIGVSAGRFYLISLETFKDICSTSYSYFTILQTLITDN